MRIISGWAKGRRLVSPPAQNASIRPTSDRARESLFNIVAGKTRDASVLDLFAGTGALGLEALSRGAATVCFIDQHPLALTLITRNLEICMDAFHHQPGLQGQGEPRFFDQSERICLLKHDLRRGLPLNSRKFPSVSGFDLVFLDPPYSQGLSLRLLSDLDTSPLLRPNSLIVVEDRASETLPQHLTTLTLMDQRRYGDTGFWFYQPQPNASTP